MSRCVKMWRCLATFHSVFPDMYSSIQFQTFWLIVSDWVWKYSLSSEAAFRHSRWSLLMLYKESFCLLFQTFKKLRKTIQTKKRVSKEVVGPCSSSSGEPFTHNFNPKVLHFDNFQIQNAGNSVHYRANARTAFWEDFAILLGYFKSLFHILKYLLVFCTVNAESPRFLP